MEPELILFDEPTSALHPELHSEVLEMIRNLITTVIVAHETRLLGRSLIASSS